MLNQGFKKHEKMRLKIDATTVDLPEAIPSQEVHEDLLHYLRCRLDSVTATRSGRLIRYVKVDRVVSTWQVLSAADQKRLRKEEATGNPQAIAFNLPIAQMHIEDMVAFYAGVYAPTGGSFYQLPEDEDDLFESAALLVRKMNQDAKEGKYYKELCGFLRSSLKYNIGGMSVQWITDEGGSRGRNLIENIDMYNFLWDSSIEDPSQISEKGEWAAVAETESYVMLARMERKGLVSGVDRTLGDKGERLSMVAAVGNQANYYRVAPKEANLTGNPAEAAVATNWDAIGAGLSGEAETIIENHEVVTMYCWVNPSELGIGEAAGAFLWKFKILDGKYIISAETHSDDPDARIPYYCCFLNQDTMGEAQKSTAEQLKPFQSFASFLLNTYASATRKNIWGITGYDPSMFDLNKIPAGDTAARVASKIPGRDVRTGIFEMSAKANVAEVMPALSGLLGLMQSFFPAQALPSQIAGMDRAVTSQVSAVMQGVNRRLHMHVQVLDSDAMSPIAIAAYRNIVEFANDGIGDMKLDDAIRILGSGILQLSREASETAMRQLLFALIQNPDGMPQLDKLKLFNYWGSMLNLDVDLKNFVVEQPEQAAGPAQEDPAAMAAAAMAAGGATQ